MCDVYLMTQGTRAGIASNQMVVTRNDKEISRIPFQTIDTISVYGNVQLTTQLIGHCLNQNVPVSFFSGAGFYKGELQSQDQINVELQRHQTEIYNNSALCLAFAKRIIDAKIHNQRILLRRYSGYCPEEAEKGINELKTLLRKMKDSDSLEKVMGYEGLAARVYFGTLGKLVVPELGFNGRSKRPPRDPFNALISLGYTLLHNEIGAKISASGIYPYFGIMHKDRSGHKALASDLTEEWRPIIADSLAMSLINGKELHRADFVWNEDGVFLKQYAMKEYIEKYRERMDKEYIYLNDDRDKENVHALIKKQTNGIVQMLRKGDIECYQPVKIR